MTTSSPTSTPAAKEPWQWQTRVLLRSNEGDRYEIDRNILKEGSVFFGTLFEIPRPAEGNVNPNATECSTAANGTTTAKGDLIEPKDEMVHFTETLHQVLTLDEEIDIDASTADMISFADLLHISVRFSPWTKPANFEISLEEVAALIYLADMYDCPDMLSILQKRAAFLATGKPWEVLVLVCNTNDVEMGQIAIANLSEYLIHNATRPDSTSVALWDNLAKLSSAWQLEFLRLYMPCTRRYISNSAFGSTSHLGTAHLVGQFNGAFGTWAKQFNPDKYE